MVQPCGARLIVTRGLHAAEQNPTRHLWPWPELVTYLAARVPTTGAKDGEWLCFSDFGGLQRSYENLLGAYCVVLDIDTHEPDWSLLSVFTYAAWTTYKHAPGAPRWRVVFPLAEIADRYRYYATWEAAAALCGGADGAAKDATRLNYLPGACLHPEAARFRTNDGALFPVCAAADIPSGTEPEWTTEPHERYACPLNDEQLLEYALRGSSAERAFGASPTKFGALWHGETSYLVQKYPATDRDGAHQAYSHTGARGALANECLYLKGGDCESALEMMLRAPHTQVHGWDERKCRSSIIKALDRDPDQYAFLRPMGAPVAPTPPADLAVTVTAEGVVIPPPPPEPTDQFSDFFAYQPKHEYIHRPTGMMWPAASVDTLVGGKMNREMLDLTVPVHALAWAPGRPERFQWRDLDPTNEKAAACWVYNKYQAPREPRNAGDVSLWLNTLRRLYPKDAHHILMYLADAVQNPGAKTNHALVLGSRVHGIGKDTLLIPLHWAVGAANYRTIKPSELLGTYNPWVAARILQISESRNLGDSDGRISKYEMYESTKDLCAAPPVMLGCVDKYINRIEVVNVVHLIITTNHEIDGLYLPPEDRRYYCAWSDAEAMPEAESKALYEWYAAGGDEAVAYYLTHLDVTGWNRGAPPPKTEWWHLLVEEGNPQDANPLQDPIEALGSPDWVTTEMLAAKGGTQVQGWLNNPQNIKSVSRMMSKCGYRRLRNTAEKRGRWFIGGKKQVVYAKPDVTNIGG